MTFSWNPDQMVWFSAYVLSSLINLFLLHLYLSNRRVKIDNFKKHTIIHKQWIEIQRNFENEIINLSKCVEDYKTLTDDQAKVIKDYQEHLEKITMT